MKSKLTSSAMLMASFAIGMVIVAFTPGCDNSKPSAQKQPIVSDTPTLPETNDQVAVGEPSAVTDRSVSGAPVDEPVEASNPVDAPTDDNHAVESNMTPGSVGSPENETENQPSDNSTVESAAPPTETVEVTEPADAPDAVPQDEVAVANPVELNERGNPVVPAGDWRQWGGTSYRNNVPTATGITSDFESGTFDRKTGEWNNSQNIKWVSQLGSQTYGNPVIVNGRVFVGTNNSGGYLKRYPFDVDLGCLLAFNEADGAFLWQHSNEKLPTGRVHDWEMQGVCSTSYVEGNRLWYVTNRGTVVCLDTEGFYDGEDDGPVVGESGRLFDVAAPNDPDAENPLPAVLAALNDGQLSDYMRVEFSRTGMPLPDDVILTPDAEKPNRWTFAAEVNGSERQFQMRMEGPKLSVYKTITPDDTTEADVIWSYDMMKGLGSSQHNMCSCSITALGDILFVCTSNGVDESHENIPAADAPSFFAMDKNTAEVYWTDNSPADNILHGQWSSPAVAMIDGAPQVIFGGGDGWLYSFRADKGQEGKPELLWKFDCNPKESLWLLAGRGTRNNIIATPVIYDEKVYVAVGQDPEHGEGDGHLWCIDPTKRGDVSPELAVKIEGDERVPLAHRRLQAVVAEDGEVAVDNPNSAAVWHYHKGDWDGNGKISFEETMHRSCGTVAIENDILYISDFSGLVHCLDAKTGKQHFTYDMFAQAWGSPLIVDGKVYIGDEDGDVTIFELNADAPDPINEINMRSSVYSTPVIANGVLFISSKSYLFAIQEPAVADAAGE